MARADAELVEANEREVLLGFGALDGCELGYLPGVTLLDSGVDIPAFNGVIATAVPVEEVADVAAQATAWFAARSRPWVWRAGAGNRPDDLPARLEALGFVPDDPEPGMVADLRRIALPDPAAEAAAIEEVGEDERAFAEWFALFAPSFAIPAGVAERLAPRVRAAGRPGGPLRLFLLRDARGEALTCGSLSIAIGAAGVANIATGLEHRGRGHAHAMTGALLREARAAGCDKAVLSATPPAIGLYRRLGFAETGRRWIYVPPA